MENTEQAPEPISKVFLVLNAVIVLLIAFMAFVIYSAMHLPAQTKETLSGKSVSPVAFNNLDLQAKSVYVFDVVEKKVIFKKNEFAQFPLASLTKMMMALTATDLFPANSHVTIKKEFLQEEGDTGLLVDESWKLKDLLDFSLVVSSNDGARSVASVVGAMDLKTDNYDMGRKDFIEKMNDEARTLGLKQTYFVNESGLDEGETSGGYGSALDVGKLMEYILKNKPQLLEATKYENLTIDSINAEHTVKNTNIDIGNIPGLIASKTGYTDLAGGNLAIAFDASIGRPIIVVVLGSTIDGRFDDISKLVQASLAYIAE